MIEKFSKFEGKNKTTTKTRWEKSNLEFCSFDGKKVTLIYHKNPNCTRLT
jgi:hypothetical protein